MAKAGIACSAGPRTTTAQAAEGPQPVHPAGKADVLATSRADVEEPARLFHAERAPGEDGAMHLDSFRGETEPLEQECGGDPEQGAREEEQSRVLDPQRRARR